MEIHREDTRDSVVDLTANRLQEAILSVPEMLWDLDEGELGKLARPTFTDKGLRVSFWREVERVWAQRASGHPTATVTAEMVYTGFCSRSHFYNFILKNPKRVAWMVCPMQRYEKRLEVILSGLHNKIYELTEINIYKKDKFGKKSVDAAAARVVLDAIKLVEDRLLGTAVQRSVTKNQNLIVKKRDELALPADIDARIKELEEKLAKPKVLTIEGECE